MTNAQVFAFVILPLSIAALGWAVVFLHERFERRRPSQRRSMTDWAKVDAHVITPEERFPS